MNRLESDEERAVRKYAQKFKDKLLYWKFTVPGVRGVPDRIILVRGGVVVFIEFKRRGEKPRALQTWFITKLRQLGFRVEVIDNTPDGIRLVEELANGS